MRSSLATVDGSEASMLRRCAPTTGTTHDEASAASAPVLSIQQPEAGRLLTLSARVESPLPLRAPRGILGGLRWFGVRRTWRMHARVRPRRLRWSATVEGAAATSKCRVNRWGPCPFGAGAALRGSQGRSGERSWAVGHGYGTDKLL